MKRSLYLLGLVFSFLPGLALSDFELAGSNFKGVVGYIIEILNLLNPILFALAFMVFFWGVSKFILHSNNPQQIKDGRTYMLWAILVLFILLTYRVIIGLVASDLEIGSKTPDEHTILLPEPEK